MRQWHTAPHATPPRLARRGRHHSAPGRTSSDHYGLTHEVGTPQPFDRDEKPVEIDVDD
jgi:hypothetical protein